jgi:hypothetical protein
MSTAVVKAYSLALSFNTGREACTFLDPVTSTNIALSQDGNGNWTAFITNPNVGTGGFNDRVAPGSTVPIGRIGNVDYSVQFSNDGDARIFQAIRATITGIPGN